MSSFSLSSGLTCSIVVGNSALQCSHLQIFHSLQGYTEILINISLWVMFSLQSTYSYWKRESCGSPGSGEKCYAEKQDFSSVTSRNRMQVHKKFRLNIRRKFLTERAQLVTGAGSSGMCSRHQACQEFKEHLDNALLMT